MKLQFLTIFCYVPLTFTVLAQTTLDFTIEQPPPLLLNTEQNVLLLPSENAIIGSQEVASGGWGGYIYEWMPADGLNDNTIPDPIAQPTETTTYTLTVTDSCNCKASIEVTVTVDLVTGIPSEEKISPVKVYPNPGTKFFTIDLTSLKNESLVKISIYGSQGKLVQEHTVQQMIATEVQLDVTDLASGPYILQVQSSKILSSHRIVIK